MKQDWLLIAIISPLAIWLVLVVQALVVLLPFPFSAFNAAIFALIFALLIWEGGGVIWFAATLYAIIDWYTVAPYGLLLLTNTLAMLTLLWWYRSFFTNRSPVAAAALSALLIITRYIFYTGGYLVLTIFGQLESPPLSLLITTMIAEIAFTSPIVFISYLGLHRLVPQLRVTHTTPLRTL